MYVAARYKDVKEILATPEVFISGKGVTMNDAVNQALQGIGLCSDGDEHRRIRRAESRPLKAAGNFNSFGPLNERTTRSMSVFKEMVDYAMTQCVPGKLKPGSWAAMLHDAADAGEITEQEARLMALSYMAPSLDTTIFAISSAIWLFAHNPDQWRLLREDPSLIPNAINEVLRLESPIQGFSRFAVSDYSFDGHILPAQSRVIILFGSANRDERRWTDPERFNIRRDRAGEHVAFGYGEHACIGNSLARMEMTALFTALARKIERFSEVTSHRVINSTLRGFEKLEVTIH